jgi:hypothetical protein
VSDQSPTDRLLAALPSSSKVAPEEDIEFEGPTKEKKVSQATRLMALAENVEFFHTPKREAFASIPVDGHRETHRVRSVGFRRYLARLYYASTNSAPSSQAIADAGAVLEGQALYDAPMRPVFLRLAQHEGRIYIDLGDDSWQAIEITPSGWAIVADPPVRFRRPAGMAARPGRYPAAALTSCVRS